MITEFTSFVGAPDALFANLRDTIKWERVEYFKRKINHYRPDSDELNRVLCKVQQIFDRPIMGAFLNFYESGNDYAPYHADKYGTDCVLISLGERLQTFVAKTN